MTTSGYGAVIALASLEGALVALPRADALEPLRTLRSPAWAALLPGSIVVGTFLPLAMPSIALGLVLMAGVITPLLAIIAVLEVVRGPRAALLMLAFAFAMIAALISGWAAQLSATALTALGCLAVGTALARLIPRSWFVLGVVGMCLADVALLASGVGGSAAQLMAAATRDVHGPVFSQADIGRVTTDYPDLVLAAVLGGFLAGRHRQLLAAVLVTVRTDCCCCRSRICCQRRCRSRSRCSCSRAWTHAAPLIGNEQPPLHLLFSLRVELPQSLELSAQVVRKAFRAVVVDLDEVPGRVADVQLHDVAGKLDQVVAERRAVERVAALGGPVHRFEIVHGDPEVMVAGRLYVALEQVQLRAAEREPLHGQAEVGGRYRLPPSRSI